MMRRWLDDREIPREGIVLPNRGVRDRPDDVRDRLRSRRVRSFRLSARSVMARGQSEPRLQCWGRRPPVRCGAGDRHRGSVSQPRGTDVVAPRPWHGALAQRGPRFRTDHHLHRSGLVGLQPLHGHAGLPARVRNGRGPWRLPQRSHGGPGRGDRGPGRPRHSHEPARRAHRRVSLADQILLPAKQEICLRV